MLLSIPLLKETCKRIAISNKNNFKHLNPSNKANILKPEQIERFEVYFDHDLIFDRFFNFTRNKNQYYLVVDENWNEVLLNKFSLDKLKAKINEPLKN